MLNMVEQNNRQSGAINRSPEEIRKLKLEAAKIARMFSGLHQMAVVPGRGWACGFKDGDEFNRVAEAYLKGMMSEAEYDGLSEEIFRPSSLTYDESWFANKPEGVVKGVLRHEVGHANHSDYRLLAKGQKKALDDGYLPSSYMGGLNAREDLWVNNREMRDSETVQGEMEELYRNSLPGVLEELRSGRASLGRQLGLRETLEWLKDEFEMVDEALLEELDREVLDSRVVEAFQKTREMTLQFRNPNNTAEENFGIMRDEIWPVVKELELQNLQDEMMQQLAQPEGADQSGGGQQGQPGQGQSGSPSGGQPQPGEGGVGEGNPLMDKLPDDVKKRLQKEIDKQKGQTPQGVQGDSRDKIRQVQGGETGEPQGEPDDGSPEEQPSGGFDPREIPDDLKKKIIEAIEGMDPSDRDKLKGRAIGVLDEKQAKELEKDLSKAMQMDKDPETGTYILKPKAEDDDKAKETKRGLEKFEHDDSKNQEGKRQEIGDKIEGAKNEGEVDQIINSEDLPENFEGDLRDQADARKQAIEDERKRKKVQMENEGFEENEEELYDELKELEKAAKQGLNNFVRNLATFLPRKKEREWKGPHMTGRKLMKRELARKIPTGRHDVYAKRVEKPGENPMLFVQLVIDRSLSMKDNKKMQESLKTAMNFALVLLEFGIPFAITFFDKGTKTTLKFGEDFSKRGGRYRVELMRASKQFGGSTNIEKVLREVDEELIRAKRRYPDCLSALIFIGDGDANEGLQGDELKALVDDIKKRHITTAYALGAGGRKLKFYFGEDATVEADEFGSDLLGKARSKLKQVMRYTAKRFKLS